ncbi:hypothetical protein, partial [Burkholderia sp. LMG 13014]|uniref:hypothetical protein n=1 Tax=Burkholderia sp. LMG 13014 TaxID=2709306 RepID=UPI001962611C
LPALSALPARRRRSAPSKCRFPALTFARPNTIIRSHKEQMIVFIDHVDHVGRIRQESQARTGDTG